MQKTTVWDFIGEEIQRNESVFVVIITETTGYAPGKTGAKMAVTLSGNTYGTIGGGKAENDLKNNVLESIKNKRKNPQIIEYKFDNDYNKTSDETICGGKQKFLIFELIKKHLNRIEQIISIQKNHKPATINWFSSGEIEISETNILNYKNKIKFVNSDPKLLYSEITGNEPLVHIIGGGHVSLALSKVLVTLDYYIKIYDERPYAATIIANTYANEIIISPFAEVHKQIKTTRNDYVVIMTPGHKSDETVLRSLINMNFKYLGMMASPRKSKIIKQKLIDEGIDAEKLNHVYSPIGIPINSNSPEEIAISIAAQIISLQNG